jgi:hypothetical protein
VSGIVFPVRIGHLFPARPARKPKHSAPAEVDRLRHKLTGAELLIGGYQLQLDMLEREHDVTVRGLESQIARLQAALQAWESRWANAHPVHVPAPRDLRSDDERPTVPTDVSSLRAIVPVIPIPVVAPVAPVFEQLSASIDPTIVPASALRD